MAARGIEQWIGRDCPNGQTWRAKSTRSSLYQPDIDGDHEVYAVLEERVEQWNRELIEKGRNHWLLRYSMRPSSDDPASCDRA
jgi:hypothetical protein